LVWYNIWKWFICCSCYLRFTRNILNNNENLYIYECHPIWINKNQNQNRIFSKDIKDCETFLIEDDILYNIQYDEEGTFYANGIKIDSLSPYHQYYLLPLDLFIDKTKFIKGIIIKEEDDKIRNKPKMIIL